MDRTRYTGRDVSRALAIEDLRQMAWRRLPYFCWEYLEGGAEDEVSMARNRECFNRIGFLPKQLMDVRQIDLTAQLWGRPMAMPLIVAPTGFNGMLWRHGDAVLARLAADAGIPSALSTVSSDSLEHVAAAAPDGRRWFQLYLLTDPAVNERLVERAEAAGCEALILTTDANVFGNREWDKRNFPQPRQLRWRAKLDVLAHPRWMANVLWPHGMPEFGNLTEFLPPDQHSAQGGALYLSSRMHCGLHWDMVRQLRERWRGKLLVKGILRTDDAQRALQCGVDGIVISNHGGRQLDGAVAPLDVLPAIAAEMKGRMTLLVDSGFRRGSDIAKALALGADAVLLGRSLLYGLAAAGPAGAARALGILQEELARVLGQLGCPNATQLNGGYLHGINEIPTEQRLYL